jgi:hypothetical protein
MHPGPTGHSRPQIPKAAPEWLSRPWKSFASRFPRTAIDEGIGA